MPLSTGDSLDLAIESLAYRGQGIARHEGLVVFVAGVAPGERVRARIARLHRNYAEAQLLAVLEPSPDRIAPCCRLPNGTRVPGCVYDHLAYPAEVAQKQRQFEDFLRRLPGAAALAFDPPFPSPRERAYRNKIVLHARRPPHVQRPQLGYVGDDNRTVLDIPACPLAREEINAALAAFRKSPEFRRLRDGDAVSFRWTAADGVRHRVEGPSHPACAELLTEQAPFGPVRVPADGFYQVNPEVAAELVRQVTAWFSAAGCGDLLDLYCGAGVFVIACARAGARQTAGIESGRAAVAAAAENARLHNVPVRFDCREMRAAARESFGGFPMANATVIADPPRQGLEPEVAQALAAAQPRRIFYVSCDPATLARDLKMLLPAGYALRAARLFDMFPRTAHFETAVWLERVTGP